jgi:prophage DNA circulation protein
VSGFLGGTIGAVANATQEVRGIAQSVQGLANLPGLGHVIDNTGTSWGSSAWWLQLQPGSWRNCGFVMDVAETVAGRRVAIHEYPYRDSVWVEDLGRLPRRFGVTAYLVGDDVYSQRDAMVRACEQPGPGILVHPTMGSVQVVLLEFNVQDRRERGRYVEVSLQFILAGDPQFPSSSIATGDLVAATASALNAASKSDLSSVLGSIGGAVSDAAKQVTPYINMATRAVGDAAAVFGSVRGMVGTFGRFAGGHRMTTLDPLATVQSVLSEATSARSAVTGAAGEVSRLVGIL